MAESPTSTDGQGWIAATVSGAAGSTVTVTDGSGTELVSFTAVKQFGSVVYSGADVSAGSAYTVTVDGAATQVTAGEDGSAAMGGPGGGPR
jgi:uncharacterized heparinase superfamily protein